MADRIEKNLDVHVARRMGWHGKTDVMPVIERENIPFDDKKWEIVETPLWRPFDLRKGNKKIWTPFKVLTCSDKPDVILGQPYRNTYFPLSNKKFLDLVFEAIAGTPHEIESAGTVCGRQKLFVSIQLKNMETFEAAGRKFSQYLNFMNGHGKAALVQMGTSCTCIVCDNTYEIVGRIFGKMLNGDKGENQDDFALAGKHTKNLEIKLPKMAIVIDKYIGARGEFIANMDILANENCDANKAEKFFAGFVTPETAEKISTRGQNTVEKLVNLFQRGAGNRGNDFSDVFQAGTDYYSHESSGGEDRMKQYVSSEFGAGNNRKTELFSILRNPGKRAATIERGEVLLANS